MDESTSNKGSSSRFDSLHSSGLIERAEEFGVARQSSACTVAAGKATTTIDMRNKAISKFEPDGVGPRAVMNSSPLFLRVRFPSRVSRVDRGELNIDRWRAFLSTEQFCFRV
jgi:hypothetical protein